MALQAQWSLDNTADSAIAISRGILKAATSDNVQPLAIIACERFGNTLAICPETCHKVERVILPTPPPAVLRFMRGVVGYSADDCATQLGSSLAGVRFLALATTLVTTMDLFEAAWALSTMLRSSASDHALLPTVAQLKELLISVEPRCQRSRFAEEVIGWQCMLRNIPGIGERYRSQLNADKFHPSNLVIEETVKTFRRLHRIGDSTAESATFELELTVPWLVAFTKWCLGKPPSVYLQDGTPLMEQPGQNISIIIKPREERFPTMSVTTYHKIAGPRKLLLRCLGARWHGMVSIETFGQRFLAYNGSNRAGEIGALGECLARAIGLVLRFVRFSDARFSEDARFSDVRFQMSDSQMSDSQIMKPLFRLQHTKPARFRVTAEYLRLCADC